MGKYFKTKKILPHIFFKCSGSLVDQMSKRSISIVYILISVIVFASNANANHGPATTGGGSSTISGETLKQDSFVFSLDESHTNFENVLREEAEVEAVQNGEFDALRDAYVTNLSMAYGITDDFQIEAQFGWYPGRGIIDAYAGDASSFWSRNARYSINGVIGSNKVPLKSAVVKEC